MEGNWKQFKSKARSQRGRLTDDRLGVVAGKRDQPAAEVREAYGAGKGEAEEQIRQLQQTPAARSN